MGHFSHNCKLTGLPITDGTPVALFPMVMRKSLYDNSEEHMRQFGSTYMCSNDGARLKYVPCMFPIIGDYDDYGGIENIVEDENTKAIEEYYGLTIQEVCNIITCGRKDDGYSESLKVIKKEVVYPSDWIKGERHFDRYQRVANNPMPFGNGKYPDSSLGGEKPWTVIRDGKRVPATKEEYDNDFKLIHAHYKEYEEWAKTNPDVEKDFGNPQYQERYLDLIKISGMWVHGDVYKELTNEAYGGWDDRLHLGTNGILESVGFTRLTEKGSHDRFNIQYEKDGLIINGDGTWIQVPNESIFRLKDLKKYCEKNGVSLDIEEADKKDKMEQIFDYVLPNCIKSFRPLAEDMTDEEIDELLADDENGLTRSLLNLLREKGKVDKKLLSDVLDSRGLSREQKQIAYYFLNLEYDGYKISNPITNLYLNKASQGQLKENLVKFWRFDTYMYDCGRFYDVVGTGPQDGERKSVMKVLNIATKILQESIDDFYEDYDDEE